jgi:hypothetical protein
VVSASAIALLNGNVGALVRLRVLAIPYLTWVSMVGICELLARTAGRRRPHVFKDVQPT